MADGAEVAGQGPPCCCAQVYATPVGQSSTATRPTAGTAATSAGRLGVVRPAGHDTGGEGALQRVQRGGELGDVGVLGDDGDGTEALLEQPAARAAEPSVGASSTAAGAHQPCNGPGSTSSTTRAPAQPQLLEPLGCRSCDPLGQHDSAQAGPAAEPCRWCRLPLFPLERTPDRAWCRTVQSQA